MEMEVMTLDRGGCGVVFSSLFFFITSHKGEGSNGERKARISFVSAAGFRWPITDEI